MMRSLWKIGVAGFLLGSSGYAAAQTVDWALAKGWDAVTGAQVAARCPRMAAWMQAQNVKAEVLRKKYATSKLTRPDLRTQLLKMADADRKARGAAMRDGFKSPDLLLAVGRVDALNQVPLMHIVAAHGFPTLAEVGKDGVDAAFLLVLHAEGAPNGFQSTVLAQLQARRDLGGVDAEQLAELADGLLLSAQGPQRYGTQFAMLGSNVPQPLPIKDPANVEKRRAAIGLPPLADYACLMDVVYRLQDSR